MLPSRLAKLAELIPRGSVVADVGTDHLLLPVYLVECGVSERVIAVESSPGPYQRALFELRRRGMEDSIDLRRQNGLEGLRRGDADVVVIAGLGGITIATILTLGDPSFLRSLKLILLQPMGDTAFLRKWLLKNGYPIVREELVEDAGRIYEVVAVEPGAPDSPYRGSGGAFDLAPDLADLSAEVWFEIGLCLWRDRNPLLERFIRERLRRYQGIRSELSKANCPPKDVVSGVDKMLSGLEAALRRLSGRE